MTNSTFPRFTSEILSCNGKGPCKYFQHSTFTQRYLLNLMAGVSLYNLIWTCLLHSLLQTIHNEEGSSLKYYYCIKHLKVLATDGSKTSCTALVPLQQFSQAGKQIQLFFNGLLFYSYFRFLQKANDNVEHVSGWIYNPEVIYLFRVKSLLVLQLESVLSTVSNLWADTK